MLISCSNENCEMKVLRKDLEEHSTKKCQWRTVDCDHCHELYPECQMEVIRPAVASKHLNIKWGRGGGALFFSPNGLTVVK